MKAHRGSMTFFQVFLSHTRRIFGNLTCIFPTVILQAHQIRQSIAMTELQSSLLIPYARILDFVIYNTCIYRYQALLCSCIFGPSS
jgi:hypothetical protein